MKAISEWFYYTLPQCFQGHGDRISEQSYLIIYPSARNVLCFFLSLDFEWMNACSYSDGSHFQYMTASPPEIRHCAPASQSFGILAESIRCYRNFNTDRVTHWSLLDLGAP